MPAAGSWPSDGQSPCRYSSEQTYRSVLLRPGTKEKEKTEAFYTRFPWRHGRYRPDEKDGGQQDHFGSGDHLSFSRLKQDSSVFLKQLRADASQSARPSTIAVP